MRSRAGIIGVGLLGLALTASAYTSPYSSMAVAGSAFPSAWNVTPNLYLVADNTWVGTQEVTAASGQFKFAANGSWAINWGGNASLFRVPAAATAPTSGGDNLSFSGLSNGLYRFTFNDSTLQFRMEWAGVSPLPIPAIASLALVGNFNGWTPSGSSLLTNSPGNTNLWSGSIDLQSETAFQFRPDGDADNQWGAPEAAIIVPTNLLAAVTNSACGKSSFTLSSFVPGTFLFALNVSNATFTITQTATQAFTIGTMTVQGNFIETNNPPPNMARIGDTTSWESDHHLTNSGTITLRFSANSGVRRWGTADAAVPLPASGTLATGLLTYASVSGVVPGRYRITFDHQTGSYTFRQVYTDASDGSGINLLKNPGFEQTTQSDGGDAVNWGSWQSWPKRVADGYAPHSGNWCGAIHGQMFPEWTDYASFAQDVLVTAGKTYRAAAWFKATTNWSASSMQIKVEWLDATNGPVGGDIITDIPALSNQWVHHIAEGVAPEGATKAHVVFLCAGAGATGTMHIDDAEMRSVAGRTQNFDSWGALTDFAAFAPDWSVTSGKVINNVPPGRPPAGVFISQYVEGTGNNKAVEIFNGTLSDLDLAAGTYVLQQYNNGSLTATVTMALSGTLQPGACTVVGRPNLPTNYAPDLSIGGLANLQTNKYLTFNGDDVLVLRSGGALGPVVDRVGQVGTNATGSIWSRNTKDHTLQRKNTVFTGTVNAVTSAFPLLDEWNLYASDTFADLGVHEISYLDPNEPYTPAGLSLILNSGATLMSGDLAGGIGDVSFWYRTESMAPVLTLVIETAASEDGPWTNADTLSGIASSNFAYYVVAVNRADHLYVRFRQTDGGTNRFRIDEITVTEPSSVRRFEDFNAWTDPAYATPGSYTRYGWAIQSSSIVPTTGVYATRAALISPPNSAIVSPAYEEGVGEVLFWTKANDTAIGVTNYLLLQTTIDGTNWVTQRSLTSSTSATYSTWLYLTNNGAQVRIVFDPAKSSDDTLIDNVEVRVPALYRNQGFDAWPFKSGYTNGTHSYQGWSVSNCIVDAQLSYIGMAARLRNIVHVNSNAWIQSPYFPDGIGSISYRMRKVNDGDTSPSVQIQVSPNGVGWTTLATNTATSTNYAQFVLFREDPTNHFVRFVHTAGASAVPIDDIRIGVLQPRPQASVTPGSSPSAPASNQTAQILADIVTSYGASIVSVTGHYWTTSTTSALPMTAVAYGSYASISSIPAQPVGATVYYYVRVQYAGIGAAPGSTGYSTSTVVSVTNSYRISSVRLGDVWINEMSYLLIDTNNWTENDEFIELCGVAGSSISNWTVQLAFGADADIATNGGQPVYATYKITGGHTFSNQVNGFSFYVLGDQQLTNKGTINKYLTTLVPPLDLNWGDNHIQDSRGVVRLLNEYSNVVYSLSYSGSAVGSDRIPASQLALESNAVSLVGTGSSYDQFATWKLTNLTIGAVNAGQTLVPPGTAELADVWHTPGLLVYPANPPPDAFYMRDPLSAQNQDALWLHFGYSTTNLTLPDGTLYYRQSGYPTWNTLPMSIRQGSADSNDNAYVAATIPLRTFSRGTSLEYVMQANPNKAGISTAYLGDGPTNGFQIFESLAEAQASPFLFTYAIRSGIFITNMATNASSWIFYTAGNDIVEPFTHFRVYVTTNLLNVQYYWNTNGYYATNVYPSVVWATNSFTVTPIDAFGQNVFTVPKAASTKSNGFYRIDLLWP